MRNECITLQGNYYKTDNQSQQSNRQLFLFIKHCAIVVNQSINLGLPCRLVVAHSLEAVTKREQEVVDALRLG